MAPYHKLAKPHRTICYRRSPRIFTNHQHHQRQFFNLLTLLPIGYPSHWVVRHEPSNLPCSAGTSSINHQTSPDAANQEKHCQPLLLWSTYNPLGFGAMGTMTSIPSSCCTHNCPRHCSLTNTAAIVHVHNTYNNSPSSQSISALNATKPNHSPKKHWWHLQP